MNQYSKNFIVHDTVNNPEMQRGVDRCFNNYSSALIQNFPGHVKVFSNRINSFPIESNVIAPSKYLRYPIPRRIGRYLDSKIIQLLANSNNDLYYSPYYGKVKTKTPQIFTAYDMIYEKYPSYYPGEIEGKFVEEKKDCFYRAKLIVCISQSTANDLLDFYPELQESKIRVVYLGVDSIFREAPHSIYNEKPYFLYVGNRSLYKNFPRFLQAFGKSNLSKNFNLRIISPIHTIPTDQEKELIRKYHLENDIQIEESIPDPVLHERYANAYAYVCPSQYEGFGLPLMEAMASGTLVLSSNASSLPEIGGETPLYFDPLSEDSIIHSLITAASISDIEREARILKGKIHSQLFSWENSRKNFIEAINSIL